MTGDRPAYDEFTDLAGRWKKEAPPEAGEDPLYAQLLDDGERARLTELVRCTAGKVDDDTATRRIMRKTGLGYRDALALLGGAL